MPIDPKLLDYCQNPEQKRTIAAVVKHGSNNKAAKMLGKSRRAVDYTVITVKNQMNDVESITGDPLDEDDVVAHLREQVRLLKHEVLRSERDKLTARQVRSEIFRIADSSPEPPDWLIRRRKLGDKPGVPTLFASDWHWGEVVNPEEVGGVNEFNLDIAHRRAKRLVERAIILLRDHVVTPDYPGIIFPLGGDMITGDIHEELSLTNELPVLPTIVDLVGILQWCVSTLADEFGKVFVPCVTGNHGRMSSKPRAKQRNHTNFDWLIYTLLDQRFQNDNRVHFYIPESTDAAWYVFGRAYKMTHGDQFRGGDGLIGPLGPIARGDHKKRSRDTQLGQHYDTLIMGHFHSLMQLERFIVNGSLKGYDEYAYSNNFGFEPARQALWITHPRYGITISMPVLLQDTVSAPDKEWIGWRA